ncbi:hypothetical protein [Streptomyces spectabilis]|uniref:DUF7848 domain-containing protein n=1 Tax=Streptomyces spectabilis TaxID=68270 RepID=A0A5P2X2A0_STRST|nr:hypothetical protein [Streptomyces spectabilis]MBB5108246.1 hypothetical protein [Streptomyces spectabilis]MCI3901008.1 hypothetical protein [Streptomyces spectabilis]QEV58508.1 hypothetical protein CP982_07140 [Streptomyces spectabilis]GGV45441.1 hypothetical protein GCM10010245_71070 [Streptomyces spectabilis]
MTRAAYRYVDWSLGTDPEQPLQRRIECASCSAASGDSPGQLGPEQWALRHAAATGHRDFQEIAVAYLRATPAVEDA